MFNKSPRFKRMLALSLLSLWLTGGTIAFGEGPSSKAAGLLKKADDCRKALFASEAKKKFRHHWQRCIETYIEVHARYPGSDQAAWALYRTGQMYRDLYRYSGRDEDLEDAVRQYKKLAEEYPDHRLADDAQYLIGDIYSVERENYTQAYVEFLKVDIKHPSGDMRSKARKKLDELAAILSAKGWGGQEIVREGPSATALTRVEDIRHWSTPTYTRIVIDLERPVKYESHLLKEDPANEKPRRLYLDLEEAYVTSDIESSIPIGDGLLQRARAGQYQKDTVRVVLDINSIGGYKVFPLHDPFRIVVDVRSTGEGGEDKKPETAAPKAKPRAARKGIRKVEEPDKSVSLARQLGLTVRRIVIDPGHGGKDPGCFINGKIQEKHIVLDLAKTLARKVETRLGCEAVLTRTKDVFVPLERRTAFANMNKADLFVSLHINAHKQKSVQGLETYFLNMATDARAVMVAARENATSEKNISDLQTILNDLLLNTKISESNKLAHEVHKGMVGSVEQRYRKVRNLGVKQAPFYVLIGAEMPAILIETGFITNATERTRLLSKKYLETLADGIVAGIDVYIKSIDQTAFKGG